MTVIFVPSSGPWRRRTARGQGRCGMSRRPSPRADRPAAPAPLGRVPQRRRSRGDTLHRYRHHGPVRALGPEPTARAPAIGPTSPRMSRRGEVYTSEALSYCSPIPAAGPPVSLPVAVGRRRPLLFRPPPCCPASGRFPFPWLPLCPLNWWALEDSNLRPQPCEGCALTN